MCDWTDCPGQEASGTDANMTTPNPQSNHASTSGGARTNCERFSNFVDDDELAALSKGVVPAGTDKCTRWALANFGTKSTLKTQFQRTSLLAMTRLHSTRTFLGLW